MEDLEHLWHLRAGYRERIHFLEAQQARFGTLPTGQALELQQARRDLEIVEAQLQNGPPSPELSAASGPDVRMAVVEYQVKSLSETMTSALRTLDAQLAEIRDTSATWRASEQSARRKGQAERAAEVERIQQQLDDIRARAVIELRRVWIGVLVVAIVVLAVLLLWH